jgi:DNA-directed RNA polymerase subunit K/omega
MDKEDEPLYSSSDEDNDSENEVSEEEDVKSEVDDVNSEADEEDEQEEEKSEEENEDENDEDNESDEDQEDFDEDGEPVKSKPSSSKPKPQQLGGSMEYESEDDDDNYQSPYLQKFNADINKNYILDFHPECAVNNYDEISVLTQVIRDAANNIIDDLHKTIPFLTKYERTRVIGQRAKQINSGAKAFVKVPENVIDGYLIAELELMQKRIPFIIRRPTPGGGCEYWNLKDLEAISF